MPSLHWRRPDGDGSLQTRLAHLSGTPGNKLEVTRTRPGRSREPSRATAPWRWSRYPSEVVSILAAMSARLDPSWSVLSSPSTLAVDRCVDIFVRPDGTYGFEEFRRDPEDMGAWTPIAYYSSREFQTESDALAAARAVVLWLPAVLDGNT
jgi:hypothetical protein